ncbi:MAG: type II toxin-antitoxin system death-on-curing family toxin [Anaerolineaceae bacterium]|nr:type II toxin-antitoxin system death-on-curing family toxin [Anaerolineaceae bacterium]
MNSPNDDDTHSEDIHINEAVSDETGQDDPTEEAPSVVYLTVNDLYNINEQVVKGIPFVRDYYLLQSAARRPRIRIFGQPQFPTLLDKAAALLHSLAYRHLFTDGNKRTAARAVSLFLEHNGIQPTWKERDLADFLLKVAQEDTDTDTIAAWLAAHTTKADS